MRHACLWGIYSLGKEANNQINSDTRLMCLYGPLQGTMDIQKEDI